MEMEVTSCRMLGVSWAFLWRFLVCLCVDIVLIVSGNLIFAALMAHHSLTGCYMVRCI